MASVFLQYKLLDKYTRNLQKNLGDNSKEKLDELERIWLSDKSAAYLQGVMFRLRQGEYRWALGILVSEQDKFVGRETSPTHMWFRKMVEHDET
jgi:hypothetical protein